MIIDEDVYLEHFGVKGMKWGVRRQLKKEQYRRHEINRHRQGKLTGWERAGAIAGGYALGSVASLAVLKVTRSVPIATVAAYPAAVAGGLWIRKKQLKSGGVMSKPVSSIKKDNASIKDDEAIRRVEEFIKKNSNNKT